MISRLRGTLVARELERAEVLTPGGVGYEVWIPLSVYERLPRVGEEVELRIHQVVREDAILLFGFLEDVERTVFTRLISAQGVGPRLALSLLSALPADRLVRAIREKDIRSLTGVSGVGKKTAERMVLELAGKLDDIPLGIGRAPASPAVDEAVRALVVLGFPAVEAERAVREVLKENGSLAAQEIVRQAVAHLR
jgi:holliday junction DNA helicase RuvA